MKPLQHAVLAASLVLAACGGGSDAGSPSPGPGPAPAAFTLELERMASGNEVEAQLAAMKAEIGGPEAAPAIEAPDKPQA